MKINLRKIIIMMLVTGLAGTASAATLSSSNFSFDVDDIGFSFNTGPGSSVWNCTWYFSDGTVQAFSDDPGAFTGPLHQNDLVGSNTGTTASTNSADITAFGGTTAIPNLTGTLDISVNDGPGSSAVVTYAWTIDNSGGSAVDLTIVWFLDGDVPTFSSNLSGFTSSDFGDYSIVNTVGAPGIGLAGTGGAIDLSTGYLLDSNVNPAYLLGLGDSGGASFWWASANNFAGLGVEENFGIPPALQNNIVTNGDTDGDTDDDFIQDTPQDSGVALQWEVSVPASGSTSLEAYLVYGIGQELQPNSFTSTAVSDWSMY